MSDCRVELEQRRSFLVLFRLSILHSNWNRHTPFRVPWLITRLLRDGNPADSKTTLPSSVSQLQGSGSISCPRSPMALALHQVEAFHQRSSTPACQRRPCTNPKLVSYCMRMPNIVRLCLFCLSLCMSDCQVEMRIWDWITRENFRTLCSSESPAECSLAPFLPRLTEML